MHVLGEERLEEERQSHFGVRIAQLNRARLLGLAISRTVAPFGDDAGCKANGLNDGLGRDGAGVLRRRVAAQTSLPHVPIT